MFVQSFAVCNPPNNNNFVCDFSSKNKIIIIRYHCSGHSGYFLRIFASLEQFASMGIDGKTVSIATERAIEIQ